MAPMDYAGSDLRLGAALQAETSSARLNSALVAGTNPDPRFVELLLERSAVEPDFFMRDPRTGCGGERQNGTGARQRRVS